jgi:hypothetical protein
MAVGPEFELLAHEVNVTPETREVKVAVVQLSGKHCPDLWVGMYYQGDVNLYDSFQHFSFFPHFSFFRLSILIAFSLFFLTFSFLILYYCCLHCSDYISYQYCDCQKTKILTFNPPSDGRFQFRLFPQNTYQSTASCYVYVGGMFID